MWWCVGLPYRAERTESMLDDERFEVLVAAILPDTAGRAVLGDSGGASKLADLLMIRLFSDWTRFALLPIDVPGRREPEEGRSTPLCVCWFSQCSMCDTRKLRVV